MSDILHGRKHPKVGARPGAAAGETAAAVASKKKGLQLMRDADRAQAGAATSQAIASFADGSNMNAHRSFNLQTLSDFLREIGV